MLRVSKARNEGICRTTRASFLTILKKIVVEHNIPQENMFAANETLSVPNMSTKSRGVGAFRSNRFQLGSDIKSLNLSL